MAQEKPWRGCGFTISKIVHEDKRFVEDVTRLMQPGNCYMTVSWSSLLEKSRNILMNLVFMNISASQMLASEFLDLT
jgi:hypothetical protein